MLSSACNGFLFIGDPHLDSKRPGRRLDEDFTKTVLKKIEFCIDQASDKNLIPVLLGDLFDRNVVPKRVENQVARILARSKHLPIANVGNHDKKDRLLNDDDSLMSFAISGAMHVCLDAGPIGIFEIEGQRIGLGASPYDQPIPTDVTMYFPDVDMVIWITHHDLAFESPYPGSEPLIEIKGCRLAINGHMHLAKPPVAVGGTTWFNPGNITRQFLDAIDHEPAVYEFSTKGKLSKIVVPHEKLIFDLTGKLIDPVSPGEQKEGSESGLGQDSAFVDILKAEESLDMKRTDDGSVAREEVEAKFKKDSTPPEIQTLVLELLNKATAL